jgi:hypothetical protein
MPDKVTYKIYLMNRHTHCCEAELSIAVDGFLTALSDAHELCLKNYPHLYVGKVLKA